MKILFLAANPQGTAQLRLNEEVREIEEGLQRSKLRDQFQLVSKWAIDSNDLRRALLAEQPEIVHFSGHGEGQAGLVLVSHDNQPKPATAEALSGLFKQFPEVKCVLLNACYAEMQAKAIVQHIDYVIGMKQAVRDDAAIAFATGFYDGLGYGKSIDIAFELGCNAIQFELASFSSTTRSRQLIPVDFEKVELLADHLIPVLLKKQTGSTGSSTNHTPSSAEATSLSQKLRTDDDISRTNAFMTYRERVKEFLANLKLTPIEKFQLAVLANVLGLSQADANQILEEEQKRIEVAQENHRVVPSEQLSKSKPLSGLTKIGNVKNKLLTGGAILLVGLAGLAIHQQNIKLKDKIMTCTIGSSYTIKRKETLFIIAERELGDGNRWHEIMNPNASPFTGEEANSLEVGQEICLPDGSVPPPPRSDGLTPEQKRRANQFTSIFENDTI